MADSTSLPGFEPVPPHRHDSATSRRAAEVVAERVPGLRVLVFNAFDELGPATDHEVAEFLGIHSDSIRPRRRELVQAGEVVSAGIGTSPSGHKATLWALAGDPRIPHPEGPAESADLLAKIHARRPTWLGDRQLRSLIADALTACGGDQRAALRRVLRDVELLR